MLVFNEIMTPFPWYDKLEKQNRYKPNCDSVCDYKLITPKNALLPFMLMKPKTGNITSWQITNLGKGNTINLSGNLTKIHKKAIEGMDYFYYNGSQLVMPNPAGGGNVTLNLEPGFYQSVITYAAGPGSTSELLFVPENSFAVGAANDFLKLQWYNTYDLRPFYYSEKTGAIPYFINTVYLDTFITTRDPEVSIDSKKDGDDESFPTFQKVTINHTIHAYVPDFLKLALVIMGIHDTISIETAGGIFKGDIKNITTDITTDAPGCMSLVTLKFDQDLAVVNRSCADGMVLD